MFFSSMNWIKIIQPSSRLLGRFKKNYVWKELVPCHMISREVVLVCTVSGTVIKLSLDSRKMQSGFTPEISGICSLIQARFLSHLVFISLDEPGQVSMLLCPGWCSHTVSRWRPKQVGSPSQSLTLVFSSGQDICAFLLCLTKLSNRFI